MIFWGLVLLSIVIAVIGTIVFEWFLFLFEVVCCEIKYKRYDKIRTL